MKKKKKKKKMMMMMMMMMIFRLMLDFDDFEDDAGFS